MAESGRPCDASAERSNDDSWSDPQTQPRTVLRRVRSAPQSALPYLRNAVEHRLVGPLLSGRRPGAVAVFHTGRCGSTVLSDLLAQHADVYWDGETYGRVIAGIKSRGLSRHDVDFDPVEYVSARMKRSGRRWFGFDLKFSHVTEFGIGLDYYVEGLRRSGVTRFVSLRRRNYLRQVISGHNGGRRERYHLQTGDVREALPPMALDPHDLVVDLYSGSLLEHFERWDELYGHLEGLLGDNLLLLEYERDIEHDPTIACEEVASFVGLARFDPLVRLQRSNPEPIGALLANHGEIAEYLAGTQYEWMAAKDA